MRHLSSVGFLIPAQIKSAWLRLCDPNGRQFLCPLCGYFGPFQCAGTDKERHHAACPRCGSLERHRLLWLTFQSLARERDLSAMRVLHFAPERCLKSRLSRMFGRYETADFSARNVDHQVDMCNLPFPDGSFDVVVACHVLHHIRDEAGAINGLRRILRVGGFAIIPVPVFSDTTVEYSEPIDTQMRAPGRDYFNRCRRAFSLVQIYCSGDFDPLYQVWAYEDRRQWPPHLSQRPPCPGEKHEEYIPVCFR